MGEDPRDSDVTIGAVLPIKDFGHAKQRLAGFLGAAERRLLCEAMAEDVLVTLCRVPALSEIVVVTRDERAGALAARYGARVLEEPSNDGQSAAVERAARALNRAGAESLLQVPGDVPGASPDEIDAVLAAHAGGDDGGPAVTLVPSRDRRGTNCVLCSPPGALPFAFGHDSFGPHREAAWAQGIAPTILPLPGLGLDIDTPDDLRAFVARPADGRTLDYLRESGIAARLLVTDAA